MNYLGLAVFFFNLLTILPPYGTPFPNALCFSVPTWVSYILTPNPTTFLCSQPFIIAANALNVEMETYGSGSDFLTLKRKSSVSQAPNLADQPHSSNIPLPFSLSYPGRGAQRHKMRNQRYNLCQQLLALLPIVSWQEEQHTMKDKPPGCLSCRRRANCKW